MFYSKRSDPFGAESWTGKTYRLDPSFGFKGRAKNMGKLWNWCTVRMPEKPCKGTASERRKRLEVEGQLKMFDAPEGK